MFLGRQFLLPHTRGSSHGQSRVIRKTYTDPQYASMMKESFKSWRILEKETGTKLYHETGQLVVASAADANAVNDVEKSLAAVRAVYQRLTGDQINQQFPMLKFDSSDVGVYERDSGVLLADRCLNCYQKMFVHYGGDLRDGEPVLNILPGKLVTIKTSKTTYQARSVVITAGPWTDKLTRPLGLNLPLRVKRTKVTYWMQKDGITYGYAIKDNYPCMHVSGFVVGEEHKIQLYSIPSIEYPKHVKLCQWSTETTDPDRRDLGEDNKDEEPLEQFIKDHYPGLESKCSIRERCITTETPDSDFILDRHPEYDNIIIGAGFSGHGFKMAPVVGRILHQLAANIPLQDDISKFTIGRFKGNFKSKI